MKDATTELLGAPLTYSEDEVAHILSPRYFVEIRRTLGGPAPEETARAAGGRRGSSSRPTRRGGRSATDGAGGRGADARASGAPRCEPCQIRAPERPTAVNATRR